MIVISLHIDFLMASIALHEIVLGRKPQEFLQKNISLEFLHELKKINTDLIKLSIHHESDHKSLDISSDAYTKARSNFLAARTAYDKFIPIPSKSNLLTVGAICRDKAAQMKCETQRATQRQAQKFLKSGKKRKPAEAVAALSVAPQPNSTATSSSMDTREDASFSPINFDIADITPEDLFELPEEDFSMLFALTHDDPFLSPALAEAGAGAALSSVSHMETEEDSFSLSSGEESEQEEPASALPEPESKHHTHRNKHYRSFVKNIVGVRTEPYKRKPRSRKQNESDIGRLLNLDALS